MWKLLKYLLNMLNGCKDQNIVLKMSRINYFSQLIFYLILSLVGMKRKMKRMKIMRTEKLEKQENQNRQS
jgi:hypothetical protein